jgi:hypothetical protein
LGSPIAADCRPWPATSVLNSSVLDPMMRLVVHRSPINLRAPMPNKSSTGY